VFERSFRPKPPKRVHISFMVAAVLSWVDREACPCTVDEVFVNLASSQPPRVVLRLQHATPIGGARKRSCADNW
jgi:hypothetical protein